VEYQRVVEYQVEYVTKVETLRAPCAGGVVAEHGVQDLSYDVIERFKGAACLYPRRPVGSTALANNPEEKV